MAKITLLDLMDYKKINQFSLICFAIMYMDESFLASLLDDDINYEDIGKSRFVNKLNGRFRYHRLIGDTELILDLEACNGCNCNAPICKYVGNNSKEHFGLYFEFKNDKVVDIYNCNWYGNSGSPLF